jgi:hypothetical protein
LIPDVCTPKSNISGLVVHEKEPKIDAGSKETMSEQIQGKKLINETASIRKEELAPTNKFNLASNLVRMEEDDDKKESEPANRSSNQSPEKNDTEKKILVGEEKSYLNQDQNEDYDMSELEDVSKVTSKGPRRPLSPYIFFSQEVRFNGLNLETKRN